MNAKSQQDSLHPSDAVATLAHGCDEMLLLLLLLLLLRQLLSAFFLGEEEEKTKLTFQDRTLYTSSRAYS